MTSPEDVVLAVLRARDTMNYETVVALADRESVVAYHGRMCEVYRQPTFEEFAEERPDLEGEQLVRMFEAKQSRRAESESRIADSVPGVHSLAALEALDPADHLQRILERMDHRTDLIRRMRARGRPVAPELMSESQFHRYVMLGTVPEEPDLAHVLFRDVATIDGTEYRGQVEIMSTRRQTDGSWRVVVTDIHFLGPRGGSVSIIDPQFMDLYDENDWSRPTGAADEPSS